LREYKEQLEARGVSVVGRWPHIPSHAPTSEITEYTEAELLTVATTDYADVLAADTIVVFTDPLNSRWPRGSHWVEWGIGLGRGAECIVCGPKENFFCHLPHIKVFSDWSKTKAYLLERHERESKQ